MVYIFRGFVVNGLGEVEVTLDEVVVEVGEVIFCKMSVFIIFIMFFG